METTNKYLKFIVIFSLLLLVAVLSQNKLLAITIAALGVAANTCFSIMDWRKQANAEHFYNKQGQECTKQEMEAELKAHKYPKKWPIEVPEEEAFD